MILNENIFFSKNVDSCRLSLFNICLVLFEPRKSPDMTEKALIGT